MKAVLFDLDGTLLNTLEDLCDSVNYALNAFNYPCRSIDEVRFFVGNGVKKLVERALPDNDKSKLTDVLEVFENHYDLNKNNKTKPYDGVVEMLQSVCPVYKTAIVTNKYLAAAEGLKAKFFPLITEVVGAVDFLNNKPHPDMTEYALKLLNVSKEDAVYVGDSDVDILTARNAGIKLIAVSWGFRSREFLSDNGASVIASTPQQLEEILLSL